MILRPSRVPGRAESLVLIVFVLALYAASTMVEWVRSLFRDAEAC